MNTKSLPNILLASSLGLLALTGGLFAQRSGQSRAATGRAAIREKLERIIIPRLEFRDATLREGIEFLKKKSVELDVEEKDPSRKGVSIVLQLDTPALAVPLDPGVRSIPGIEAAPPAADARLTVLLENSPLIEALTYLTALTNTKYKVGDNAVSIVPLGCGGNILITKEYKVPPGFLSPPPGAADSPEIGTRTDPKEFLATYGVTFPEGATASYFSARSRLVVRNTEENLDLIDAVVDRAEGDVQLSRELKNIEAQLAEEYAELETTRTRLEMMTSSPRLETFSHRLLPDPRYHQLKSVYEGVLLQAGEADAGKSLAEVRSRIKVDRGDLCAGTTNRAGVFRATHRETRETKS